jgi:hypothetical protein
MNIYSDSEPVVLTIKAHGKEVKVTLPYVDSSISDIVNVIAVQLQLLDFSKGTVIDGFRGYIEENDNKQL